MSTETYCPDGDCPTVGVEAPNLDRFAFVETDDGELLVYDTENEDAWIQSDVHFERSEAA